MLTGGNMCVIAVEIIELYKRYGKVEEEEEENGRRNVTAVHRDHKLPRLPAGAEAVPSIGCVCCKDIKTTGQLMLQEQVVGCAP